MSSLYSFLAKVTGAVLLVGGASVFIYGLFTFAATRGLSLPAFGAVLLGYGSALIGIYVNPVSRQATEDALAALRRIADRFFDF